MDIVVVEVASVVADVTIEYRVHLADVGTGPLAGAVRSSQSSLCVQGMLRLTEWLRWTQQRFAGEGAELTATKVQPGTGTRSLRWWGNEPHSVRAPKEGGQHPWRSITHSVC